MSTGPTTLPKESPAIGTQRRLFPRLRDARIRSKLALILVVPLVAVLALATVRLVDVGRSARDANLVQSLTALSGDVSGLTQYLHKERMAAATYLAAPAAAPEPYTVQVGLTDQRISAYTRVRQSLDDLPTAVEDRLRRIDDHLNTLNGTRREVLDRRQMPVAEVVLRYGVVITDLVAYGDVLGQLAGDTEIADSLRAVAAFSRAKVATAEQEAVTFAALSGGDLSDEQYSSFVATLTSQQEALVAFSLSASATQRSLVDSTVTGDAVVLADQTSTRISRSVGRRPGITARDAARSIGAVTDLMRWAEVRLEQNLRADAVAVSSAVTRQAAIETGLVLLTLLLAIALAVVLARSLNRSLRRLREGALSVANRDLPDSVARLRDARNLSEGAVDDIVRGVRDPIQLTNRDEIGQVAQAFNAVHREAVRIAAEQAALRTSVSAMFLNTARRSQSLVDRMIGELDQIERGEEDPKRLAQLFELDHLATRMRRNDENLLVLAGADSSPPRREDALLVDALRAAQSEVELYNRIEFGTIDTDISIAANAVNDVVRLIAELLDNATRFSPPTTVVVADARRLGDQVVVQVEDRGLGMSQEQLNAVNRRLSQPASIDVGAFRLMGLAVVGRLAGRYGIRVELRANADGGTLAQVVLPAGVVVVPRNRAREQVGARSRSALAAAPARTGWPEAPVLAGPAGPADTWTAQRAGWPAITGTHDSYGDTADPRGAGTSVGAPAGGLSTSLGTPTVAFPVVQQPNGLPRRSGAAPADAPVIPATAHPLAPAAFPLGSPAPSAPADPRPAYASPGVQPAYAAPVQPGYTAPVQPGYTAPVQPGYAAAAPATGAGRAGSATGTPGGADDRAEAPIFRAMEAVWFTAHDQPQATDYAMPTAGYAPPPVPGSAGGRPDAPVTGSRAYGNTVVPDGVRSGPTPPLSTAATAAMPIVSTPPGRSPEAPAMSPPARGDGRPAPDPQPAGRPARGDRGPAPERGATGPDGTTPVDGPVPTGADTAGSGFDRSRSDQPGSDRPGSDLPGSDLPGSDLPGSDRPGSDRPGSDRPGSDRPGSDRPGSDRPGSDRPGSERPGSERPGSDRPRAEGAESGGTAFGGSDPGTGADPGSRPTVPRPRRPVEDSWQTAADEGWIRASAAAAPPAAGTTRSGLPKRVPQAQLVPGGIDAKPGDRARRTPDEVRGLLSAYHRGVKRGRSAGSAEAAAAGAPTTPSEEPDK